MVARSGKKYTPSDDEIRYATMSKAEYAKALSKYVRELNAIVDAGPKGGLRAFASGRPESERKVGGGFIPMSKTGAIAARRSKVLRGVEKKAK
jgi:hypothetical protein